MRLSDLRPARLAQLNQIRFDLMIEKHEGPEEWDGWRLQAGPEGCEDITLVRAPAVSSDGRTLFLVDRTYGHDDFFAGRIAICFKG